MSCKIYARNHTSIVYLPWSSSSKLETELHCQHIPISSFTRPKSHNFNTTRICVGLKSSAVFKICEQQSSANVLFNLQPKVYCMQSVICSLQSAVCKCQTPATTYLLHFKLELTRWIYPPVTYSVKHFNCQFHRGRKCRNKVKQANEGLHSYATPTKLEITFGNDLTIAASLRKKLALASRVE